MTDHVECKICNRKMKLISNSHLKSHGMTPSEYLIMFPNEKLISDNSKKLHNQKLLDSADKRKNVPIKEETRNKLKETWKEKKKNGWEKPSKFTDEEFYEYRKLCQRAVNNKKYIPKKYLYTDRKSNIVKYEYIDDVKNIFNMIDINQIINIDVKNRFIIFENKIKNIIKMKNKKEYIDFKIKRFEEYSNVTIKNINKTRFDFTCNDCGNEKSFINDYLNKFHLRKDVCDCKKPIVYKKSKAELEILEYIRNKISNVISGNRSVLKTKELDIYIPSLNLAIEYCGLYWHSELSGKNKNYHYDKMIECEKQNIKLITIFEDEYINNKNIVLSRIDNILGISNKKIFARKTLVKNIDNNTCAEFLKNNHLQGVGRSTHKIGLFYDNELVSVMTFQKGDISKNIKDWELNRFCSKIGYNIIGGASKLFSYFIRNNDVDKIISYSDNRWGHGNVYEKIGFMKESNGIPNYWYFKLNDIKRLHRYSLRKNKNDNQQLSEWENRVIQGYDRIWDCGSSKYIWTR